MFGIRIFGSQPVGPAAKIAKKKTAPLVAHSKPIPARIAKLMPQAPQAPSETFIQKLRKLPLIGAWFKPEEEKTVSSSIDWKHSFNLGKKWGHLWNDESGYNINWTEGVAKKHRALVTEIITTFNAAYVQLRTDHVLANKTRRAAHTINRCKDARIADGTLITFLKNLDAAIPGSEFSQGHPSRSWERAHDWILENTVSFDAAVDRRKEGEDCDKQIIQQILEGNLALGLVQEFQARLAERSERIAKREFVETRKTVQTFHRLLTGQEA